tara:strand:- start:601 stop:876 length:276 start_codon:yes stop_codon:yes gene_type:complete
MCFLNGCAANVALIAPAYTLANTGNVYHAGASYASNKAIKKITGKTTTENIKSITNNKKNKFQDKENYDEFFALVKNRTGKTSKAINSASQ